MGKLNNENMVGDGPGYNDAKAAKFSPAHTVQRTAQGFNRAHSSNEHRYGALLVC